MLKYYWMLGLPKFASFAYWGAVQILIFLACIVGILLTQILIGGARLVFAIPGYSLIGLGGVLVVFLSMKRLSKGVHLIAVASGLLLAGYLALRTLTAPVEYLARMDRFMVLACLVVYLLTAFYLTSPRHRLIVLYSLLGLALLHVAGGILQFARNDNFMFLSTMPAGSPIPEIYRGADYGWRASGFYVCPNHLAGLLEMLAMLAIARLCFGRTGALGRIVALYFALVALAGVALSGSRGGYVSTACGLMLLFILGVWTIKKLRSKKRWMLLAVVGIVALLILLGGLFAMSQSALIQKRMDNIADTNNMRLLMWAASLKQFALAPTFGTGPGTYLYYGRQFRSADVQNDPMHVHNDYLELLCEYGVVGAVLFVIFLSIHLFIGFRALRAIIRRRLRPAKRFFSNELSLLIGVLCALGALIVHSILDFNMHVPGNALFVAFLFGVLASPSVDPQVVTRPVPAAAKSARFAIPAISLAMLGLMLPLMKGEYYAEWARVNLRNPIYYRVLSQVQTGIASSLPTMMLGAPLPLTGIESHWLHQFLRDHVYARVTELAEKGLAVEKMNPDLYYYLGEGLHFTALFSKDQKEVKNLRMRAGDAYFEGQVLYPSDTRLLLKLARALDNLGLLAAAEQVYTRTFQSDPNLGNVYAAYGAHLWLSRKLVRAEAYFQKARRFHYGSEISDVGLREIERVRQLSKNQAFIEEYGDPLEGFDMEPLTPEDEARGVSQPPST